MSEPNLDLRLEHELSPGRALFFLNRLAQKVRPLFSGRVRAQFTNRTTDYGVMHEPSLVEITSHEKERHFLWWTWTVTEQTFRVLVGNCYIALFSGGSHLVLTDVDPIIKDQATEHAMDFAKHYGIPHVQIHVAMLKDEDD